MISVLIRHPVVEMGVNDDWSYIWSAKDLARTGHIHYSGWVQPILGWQLYLAAAAFRVFGFSFTIARCSVFLVTLATVFLTQRFFVRAGLLERNASLAILCILGSPMYLPLGFSFISDSGGVFSCVLCMYACLRAVQARSPRGPFFWLILAAVANLLSGTVRQVAWLGLSVMIPSTALYIRRRIPLVLFGAVQVFCVVGVFACMHWFSHQPYTMRESVFDFYPDRDALANMVSGYLHAGLGLTFFLLPVLLAFVSKKAPPLKGPLALLPLAFLLAAVLILFAPHWAAFHKYIVPFLPNYLSERGLVQVGSIVGRRHEVISLPFRVLLTITKYISTAYFLSRLLISGPIRRNAQAKGDGHPTFQTLTCVLLPFALAYAGLLVSRAAQNAFYDRYLPVLLIVAALFIVRFYQEQVSNLLPIRSWIFVGMFMLAATADCMTFMRKNARGSNSSRNCTQQNCQT